MPHIINGIGTWYVGKSNAQRRPGVCEQCGSFGGLLSYDTLHSVLFFFVPILPLGKKRVLDECPVCGRHRVVSLKEFNRARLVDIVEAFEEFKNDLSNAEKAERALGMAVAYQHEESMEVAQLLVNKELGRHAKLQEMLGDAFVYFGDYGAAEEAYRRSLAAEDSPAVREDLVRALALAGNPQAAERELAHVLSSGAADKSPFVLLVVEAYQASGHHDEALKLLDRAVERWPELADDKEVRKYRSVSTKHVATGKAVASNVFKLLGSAPPSKAPTLMARVGWAVGPVILLALVSWFVIASAGAGGRQEVFLVNGSNVAYAVEIGERQVHLPPQVPTTVDVPQGDLRISVLRDGLEVGAEVVHIEMPLWKRLFDRGVFVINPDRTALLHREEVTYAENPAPADDSTEELFLGDFLYRFDRIDYPFQAFPDEITLPSGSRVRRSRLSILGGSPVDRATTVLSYQGKDAFCRFLKTALTFDPDENEYLFLYSSCDSPDTFLDFVRPRLAERPVRLHWHRAYQEIMQRAQPEHDLVSEYETLRAEAPDDPVLTYLLARITPDPDEEQRLFLVAANAEPPCSQASAALAYGYLARGRFDEALRWIRTGRSQGHEGTDFDELERTVLLAAGEYDELLQRNAAELVADPFNHLLNVERVDLVLRSGEGEAGARTVIQTLLEKARGSGAPDDNLALARAWLESELEYRLGRVQKAAELLATVEDEEESWLLAVYRGELERASEVISNEDEPWAATHLALFIAARLEGKTELARKHLDAGIERLREAGAEERLLASWLAGDAPVDVGRAIKLSLDVDTKKAALTALGMTSPEHRRELHQLARRLNFARNFPHHVLTRACGDGD